LQPSVELYRDERSGFSYRVPDTTEIDAFRAAVEGLPGQESPEIYGLHPNADLTFRTLQVQEGVATILDTMPKGAGGSSGLSREETVDRICEDLLSKVRVYCMRVGAGVPTAAACGDGVCWLANRAPALRYSCKMLA
jgi:dynein heavy chain